MTRVLPPPALPNAPGELRQDPLGGGWVAITAGRAARPEAFLADVGTPRGPLGCPFCPGHEHMTPPEVWADRRPGTEADRPGWRVRVVPNKFPAFAGPLAAATSNGGLYRSAPTAGVHEVVIHNPDHQATLADLAVPHVARVMAAWRRRLAAHRDRALGAVLVIVNQGRTAGASLEHPHSQVFATAGRPDRIQAELDRLAGDDCAACATVAAERDGPRLVGATGELCTRGYCVMLSYWDDPDGTAGAIDAARWMHTGDLATMDEDGYVNIVGRIKDMVIRGGENVYPREIEEYLMGHPDVAAVQVVGVPDPRYGEELMAWIVPRGDARPDAEAIASFCRGRIDHHKIPRYVQCVDEFPMTVTGKVQKFKLREQAIGDLGLVEILTA